MRRLDLLPSSPEYPTASELHRAAECVAPWALGLPEAEEAPGEWAEMGRVCHAALEAYAKEFDFLAADTEENEAILYSDWYGPACAMIKRDNAGVKAWLIEQGVQWRPGFPDDEAKLIQREPGERLRGWFSGTADLAYVRADGVLVVVDWKFGPREHINGEPAQDSCQGFFLALALCTALEIRGSSAGVVVARFERRMVREDGIEVDAHDITQGELDAWAKTLAGLARRIDSADGASPKLSAACGKCRAKRKCPAWDALEAAIFGEVAGESWRCLLEAPKGPADVRARYHAAEAAEAAAERWKDETRAYLMMHPEGVEIGLGLKLRAKQSGHKAVLQTKESMALIESIAGRNALLTRSNLGAIEKAVKEAAGAGIVSKSDRDKARRVAVENAFARLMEGGAILEKGARWGVSVVRSDGTETVWMKGDNDE